jgi:8-oxo-dGTP pyrophosphatase MutT (NUDIX family)
VNDVRATVAAVCHRGGSDALELLLVRTKGGERWTFPKGHVEPPEQPWEAAVREAHEEAGVVKGHIAVTPLTSYRFPTRAGDSLVPAYLLTVLEQGEPLERRRTPTWVEPPEAVRLLASGGREPEYADEHARVICGALAALRAEHDYAGITYTRDERTS